MSSSAHTCLLTNKGQLWLFLACISLSSWSEVFVAQFKCVLWSVSTHLSGIMSYYTFMSLVTACPILPYNSSLVCAIAHDFAQLESLRRCRCGTQVGESFTAVEAANPSAPSALIRGLPVLSTSPANV